MPAEFDHYAGDYETLVKDPLRDVFAADSAFFHKRKWILLKEYFDSRRRSMKEQRWLDIGCGKGDLLRLGKDSFGEVVGCDPSEGMLEGCGDVNVQRQPESNALPFEDRSFDLVTAVCVYHHLAPADQTALAEEAFRVLKPGGLFAIFEHNPWNPATRIIVKRSPVDTTAVMLNSRKARRIMRGAGLLPVDTSYFLFFPEPLYRRFGGLEAFLTWLPAGGQYAVFARRDQ